MSYPADMSGVAVQRPPLPTPLPVQQPPVPQPASYRNDGAASPADAAAERQRQLAELEAQLRRQREQIAAMIQRLQQAQEAEAAARAAADEARKAAQRSGTAQDSARAEAAQATAATRKAEQNEAALALDAHDKHIAYHEAQAASLRGGEAHAGKVETAKAAYEDAQQLHEVSVADVAARQADADLREADRDVVTLTSAPARGGAPDASAAASLDAARGKARDARLRADDANAALETQWRTYEQDTAQRDLVIKGRELEQAATALDAARGGDDAAAVSRAEDAYGKAADDWLLADKEATAARTSLQAQQAANRLASLQADHRDKEAKANQCLIASPALNEARQAVEHANAKADTARADADAMRADNTERANLRDRAATIDQEYAQAGEGRDKARTAYDDAPHAASRDAARAGYADASERWRTAKADHDALTTLRRSQAADGALAQALRAQAQGAAGAGGHGDIDTLRDAASRERGAFREAAIAVDPRRSPDASQLRADEQRAKGAQAQRALGPADQAAADAAQAYSAVVRRPGATRGELDAARARRDETRFAQALAHARTDAYADTQARRSAQGEYELAKAAHADAHPGPDAGTPAGQPDASPSTPLLWTNGLGARRADPSAVLPWDTQGAKAINEGGKWYAQYPLAMNSHMGAQYTGGYPAVGALQSNAAPARVEMDPATARVWQAHTQLEAATRQEAASWQTYDTLKADATAMAEARREGGPYDVVQPGADAELARLAGQVKRDYAALQAAYGERYDAEDRARNTGAALDAPGGKVETARGEVDRMRANAQASAAEFERYRSQLAGEDAQTDVTARQDAHHAWKTAHPYLREQDAPTWAPLQTALDERDAARQQLVREATEAGAAQQARALTSMLSPAQREDPEALYALFVEHPQAMAQGVINAHYVDYGGRPSEMENRAQVRNMVGLAFGMTPTAKLPRDAQAQAAALREGDVFKGVPEDHADMLDVVADQIMEQGGERPRVTLIPVVYASKERGIARTMIFKVESPDQAGGTRLVDEAGREYENLDDYRANNTLPATDAVMAMPEDADFALDDKGNVKLHIGDARTESGWETFRRKTHLDTVAAGVGIVAGVVLVVGSGGTLAPVAMAAAGVATAYGVGTSAVSIADQLQHGQTWNPDKNPQMLLDGLNILAAALGVRAGVAGVRAAGAGQRAVVADTRGLADDASRLRTQADALQAQATRSGRQALAIGGGVYAYTAHSAWSRWDQMTPREQQTTRTQLLLGGAQFLVNPVSGRWVRSGAQSLVGGARQLGGAWRGTTAALDRGAQSLSGWALPLRDAVQAQAAGVRMRMAQWADDRLAGQARTTAVARAAAPAMGRGAGPRHAGEGRGDGAGNPQRATPPHAPREPAQRATAATATAAGAPHAHPVPRSRARALQDRLSRIDELRMLTWLDAGRRGAAGTVGKQRDATARLNLNERTRQLARADALHRWLTNRFETQMRGIAQRASARVAALRREVEQARGAENSGRVPDEMPRNVARELGRLEASARRLAIGWHPLLRLALRNEVRLLQRQQRDFKDAAQVLAGRIETMQHLRGDLQRLRAELRTDRAARQRGSDPLAHAEAIATRIGRYAGALGEGTGIAARAAAAMRASRDRLLETVPANASRSIRQTLEGDIYAVPPRQWDTALNPATPGGAVSAARRLPAHWGRSMAAALRDRLWPQLERGGAFMLRRQSQRLRLPAYTRSPGMQAPATGAAGRAASDASRAMLPAERQQGLTWSTVLRSKRPLRTADGRRVDARNGAANRLDAGRASFYLERTKAMAARADAAANVKSKLAAWQQFVDAVAAHSPSDGRRLAAAGGVRERYQGGEAGTVRRWHDFVPDRAAARGNESAQAVRQAYATLLGSAARGRNRDARRAAAASLRAWRATVRSAAESARITDALARRLEAAAPGTATQRALERQWTLASQAQRLADAAAVRAQLAVFGEDGAGGALAALRDTHPAAWRRVLERAAGKLERMANAQGPQSPWARHAAEVRALADRAAADPRLARVGDGVAALRDWRRAELRLATARRHEREASLMWRRAGGGHTRAASRGDRAHQAALHDAMRAAAAQRRAAQHRARSAREAAFAARSGALDRLAVAHPQAAARLLAWARRQQDGEPRLATVGLDRVSHRHAAALAPRLQGGSANARGDSAVTVADLRRGMHRAGRLGALAHGAYAAATGQVEISHDPSELKKYNLPDTTRIDGWQVTYKSRDGLNSVTLWLNVGGIKSLWVGGSTTPFAFSRDGKTTVGTRDGVNIAEGGVAYRFGLPWLSKMGMASLRIGHVKHNIMRLNFADGRLADVDGQGTWSWPITPVVMDATNVGPLRFYGSSTGNRLQFGQYGRKVGDGQLWYAKGPDLAKSRLSEIDAITLNKEFSWGDALRPLARRGAAQTLAAASPPQAMPAMSSARALPTADPRRDLAARAATVLAGFHRVEAGDTLWDIAQAHRDTLLGEADKAALANASAPAQTVRALDGLLQLNGAYGFGSVGAGQSAGDPDRIMPGWLIDVVR